MAGKHKEGKKKRFIGKLFGFLGKTIGILLLVVAVASAGCGIYRRVNLDTQKTLLANAYGRKVDVFGSRMCISIEGDGEDVVVLLPGHADVSPVMNFRSFARLLSKDFKVVTVEPFGYGLSDRTDRDRTSANIAEEIHECLSQLGIGKYVLGGHSLAGIWMIEYANRYPDEVSAVLALDNSFPTQNEELGGIGIQIAIDRIGKGLNEFGFFQGLYFVDDTFSGAGIPGLDETEQALVSRIALAGQCNENVVGEAEWFRDNSEYLRPLAYPDSIPVFWALCQDNVDANPIWRDCRAGLSANRSTQLHVYEGSHYIYWEQPDAIFADFTAFYRGL